MVAGLPRTRHDTDDERAVLATLHAPLADLRERLLELADEDTAAFDRLMAAFRLPKATDEEKTARRAAIQAATRDATTVPLQTAMVCARALDLIVTVAALGNPSASSDLLVAMGAAARPAPRAPPPTCGPTSRAWSTRPSRSDASTRIAAVLDEVTTHTHAATAPCRAERQAAARRPRVAAAGRGRTACAGRRSTWSVVADTATRACVYRR